MKEKIQSRLVKMSQAPGIFASNKESFVFQICTLLSLLEPNLVHEDFYDLYKIAGIIYGNAFMNCNDSFDYDWGKKVADYAINLVEQKCQTQME